MFKESKKYCKKGEKHMFKFRILVAGDGIEVIDCSLRTPYNSLTDVQMMEYIEVENQLYAMESIKKRAEREERKRNSWKAKLISFLVACLEQYKEES